MTNHSLTKFIYHRFNFLFRIFLLFISSFLLIYFSPKNDFTSYHYEENTPWLYPNLYAPYDFNILKTPSQKAKEHQIIRESLPPIFRRENFFFEEYKLDSFIFDNAPQNERFLLIDNLNSLNAFLKKIIELGYIQEDTFYQKAIFLGQALLVKNDTLLPFSIKESYTPRALQDSLLKKFSFLKKRNALNIANLMPFTLIPDNEWMESLFQQKILTLPESKGLVSKGTRIISKGDILTSKTIAKIYSLHYFEQKRSKSRNWGIYIGQFLFTFLIIGFLFQYMQRHRKKDFYDNKRILFLVFSVGMGWGIMNLCYYISPTLAIKMTPFCLIAFLVKAFFDFRLSLLVLFVSLMLSSFTLPSNHFFFMMLHIMAGFNVINAPKMYAHRASLFIIVLKIMATYILVSFFFDLFYFQNTFSGEIFTDWGLYILNGVLCLFALPLIYICEKVFSLTSDVSLLEWADTNQKVLRKLAQTAPGTFQHSLQVANLAEAVGTKIDADILLMRTAALYHDIGKMKKPQFFIENQSGRTNPHEKLSPKESAHIIKEHVIYGIELAKKYHLPDPIINFIRSHHGTSPIYYFLRKIQESGEAFDEKDFHYPGPLPYSKEEAILMLCDAIEAASRSVSEPTEEKYKDLVDRIVHQLFEHKQLTRASISLREIEMTKETLLKKLLEINHLRIDYKNE